VGLGEISEGLEKETKKLSTLYKAIEPEIDSADPKS
jgi:hypothetical protein